MSPRIVHRVSLWLGAPSVLAILAAHLALQDIYHGEADVTLEWRVLRVSFVIIIAFHAFALKALHATHREEQPPDPRR